MYILDDGAVNDDFLGTKLILDCDAPSGKMNFSLSSVLMRPLAAVQTFSNQTLTNILQRTAAWQKVTGELKLEQYSFTNSSMSLIHGCLDFITSDFPLDCLQNIFEGSPDFQIFNAQFYFHRITPKFPTHQTLQRCRNQTVHITIKPRAAEPKFAD